jgi:hypothetical protein
MWTDNNEIQKLKFSNKWVKKFLLRAKMYRRKITKEDKNVPTPEEIKRILGIGQNIYIEKGHRPEKCFNFDETAVTYAIGPTHVYCPKDQDRPFHNLILKKLNYEVSLSVSPSEAFGVLFLHMAVSDIPKKDESPEKVIESYNLRKSPNSLTQRSITNVSKKIISSVEEKVGVENSFFFLKSAVKVLHKKRNWDIESESDNGVEEDNDDEDDSFENRIIQGEAVQSAVKSLPKKNVSFTKKDKGVLMKLFDVVKKRWR